MNKRVIRPKSQVRLCFTITCAYKAKRSPSLAAIAGFRKIAAAAPKAIHHQGDRRALRSQETDSSASHCILLLGAGLSRKRTPQNEGNHNSQHATLGRAPTEGRTRAPGTGR